jgi:hypothetical protein
MNALQRFSLASCFVLTVPFAAQATSFTHDMGGDGGITLHPEHATTTLSRAEVSADVIAANMNGSLALLQRGLRLPMKAEGPSKSRAEVLSELEKARSTNASMVPLSGEQ